MAVDLLSFQKMENLLGIHETSSEIKAIEEQLIRILQSHHKQIHFDFSNSKQTGHRTGHARFRRGPSDPCTTPSNPQSEAVQVKQIPKPFESKEKSEECKSAITPVSSGSSSITGEDGTVSNGKLSSGLVPVPRVYSTGKPPLPSSHRKRRHDVDQLLNGIPNKPSNSHNCHCCKRRKTVEIKRVASTITKGGSSLSSSIPSDAYSWRKYDQKLNPGNLFPIGYYKCNSVKGCSARKKVMRSQDDSTVLIVTYEGEHRHHHRQMRAENLSRLNRASNVGILV